MKFKGFVGAFAATAIALNMTAFAYAATSGNYVTVGAPVNVLTGEASDTYSAGDIIAVPVDVTSESGTISAFGVVVGYNDEYLKAGVNVDDASEVSDELYDGLVSVSLSSDGENFISAPDGDVTAFDTLYTESRGKKKFTGNGTTNDKYYLVDGGATNYVYYAWYHDSNRFSVDTDHEAYLIFKVVKDIDSSALNFNIIESVDDKGSFVQDTQAGIDQGHATVESSATKLNACDGAFQIVVNSDELPYYVQGITVGGVALDAVVADGETTYKFPVRVNAKDKADATGEKEFEIKATVSTDEEGTDTKEVSWGTVKVAVDGTATGYTDASVTYGE
jgi:hypothetical protein